MMKARIPVAARTLLIFLAIGALAACGSRKALMRSPGADPVPVARGANAPANTNQLMQPDMQARPDRSAEPLKRSQEREEDPFDLPPS